jgi:hypothetical protein
LEVRVFLGDTFVGGVLVLEVVARDFRPFGDGFSTSSDLSATFSAWGAAFLPAFVRAVPRDLGLSLVFGVEVFGDKTAFLAARVFLGDALSLTSPSLEVVARDFRAGFEVVATEDSSSFLVVVDTSSSCGGLGSAAANRPLLFGGAILSFSLTCKNNQQITQSPTITMTTPDEGVNKVEECLEATREKAKSTKQQTKSARWKKSRWLLPSFPFRRGPHVFDSGADSPALSSQEGSMRMTSFVFPSFSFHRTGYAS